MITERNTYAAFLCQPAGICTLLLLITGLAIGWRYSQQSAQVAASLSVQTPVQKMDAALATAVQAARYNVSEQRSTNGEQTVEAVNAAQGMHASFTAAEVQVQSSRACQTPWQLGLQLKRYGFSTKLQDVPRGVLRAQHNRVEIQRAAQAITEWYLNKPEGIEQGFTLHARPAMAKSDELCVVMELSRGWQAKPDADGQAVTLQQGTAILRYDKLQTVDATGRVLPSRMEVNGNELALIVDDANATWPITIDPTLTQHTQLIGSNGVQQDHFGASVAVSGDTAVVGIPDRDLNSRTNQGAVLVFVRDGLTWNQQAQLTASDGASGDVFGTSVALSGDTIIVGAHNVQIGGNTSQGSAYVFVRNGSTWTQQAKLIVNDGAGNDWFGYSVALQGDTALIGAPLDDFGGKSNQGSAYVFTRSGTTWSLQRQLNANDAEDNDNFGFAVALSGETVVVGSPADDVTNSNQGSAYVFVRSGTTWSQQQRLTASDAASSDLFGSAVSLSGETIVVGSPDDDVSAADQGSAYAFVRSGTTWSQQAKLTASDGAANDNFGKSLALSNDMVVIGAPNDDVSGKTDQGSATVFVRSGSSWSQQQQLLGGNGLAGDNFGSATAINGFTALVGAPNDDVNSNMDQGSAFILAPACPTITFSPTTLANGIQNVAYPSTTISSTGGAAPISYVISAGALPTGITLTSNGVLSGTPTVFGAFNFTIKATDANLCTSTQDYSLTLTACTPPSVSAHPIQQSTAVGTSVSFTAAASGTAPNVQWQSSTDGSNWSNLDGATSATLQLTNVTIGMNGRQFRAVFTNACGTVTSNPATLTVTKLASTVALNSPTATSTYGQSVTLTASVNSVNNIAPTGTITFSTSSTTLGTGTINNGQATLSLTSLNAATHSITATYGGDTNYVSGSSSAMSVAVSKATLTVTADNKAKAYGAANPDLTATITGFVNNEAATVVTGAAALATDAQTNSSVGEYPITSAQGTLAAANYDFVFFPGKLRVNKATLTITAENKSRLYGAANPEFTATITGFVNGDTRGAVNGAPALTTTAATNSAVGAYAITAAVGSLTATNYDFTFVNGTLTITAQTLTVTAQDKNRSYGATNPAFTVQYSGFVNGDTESVLSGAPEVTTTATAQSRVGTYPITVRQGSLQTGNYALVFVDGTLMVGKAALSLLANTVSRSYGVANPTLTGTLTGVQNGDNITATFATVATVASPVNTYPITASLLDPDNKLGNYQVTQTDGTLTITPATLTITAENNARAYGAANPELTAVSAGFVNGDTQSVLSGTLQLSTTATVSSAVGTYPITVGGLSSPNYAITFVNGALTVNKALLTVAAENKTKVYGAALPDLTATITGFVNGDSREVVSGAAALTTTATTVSKAGAYPITATLGTLAATNYDFAFASATLTIGKAALTVTAANQTKVFGAALPELTYSLAGFLNGDSASVVSGAANVTTGAATNSNVGKYPINPSLGTLAADNYDFNFVSGELTITQAATVAGVTSRLSSSLPGQPVTFVAMVSAVAPGAGTPDGSVVFKAGTRTLGTATLAEGKAEWTTSALETGTHAITVEYSGSTNFIASVSQSLTHTVGKSPAPVSLASSFDTVRYGQAVALTASVSGSSPTGNVRFMNGNQVLGTTALVNGTATLTINTLPVATHTITAVYEGDAVHDGGTSRALTLTVNKGMPAVQVGSSANPAAWKQFITLSVAVNGAGNGLTAPTGAVIFKNGATVLGSSAINRAGRASISTNALPPGSHSITAEFGGDSNYEPTSASVMKQDIGKGVTAIRLQASSSTTTIGQTVYFTARVHGNAELPTGEVEFYDGEQLLGTQPLNGGHASLNINSLGDGEHAIRAVYKGDDRFAPSTSASKAHTVTVLCAWTMAASSQQIDLRGGNGFVAVESRSDCFWQAYSFDSWITVIDSGPEAGGVSFTVAPLTSGGARRGTIWVADQRLTILQARTAVTVSGASYAREGISPDAIASVFGEDLAATTAGVETLPLPTTLGRTQVKIRDHKGVEHSASLFYVSPLQINYLIPSEVALGPALIIIQTEDGVITGGGMIEITPLTPAIFTANANGSGAAAAVVQRVLTDGSQRYEPTYQFDAAQNKMVAAPIDFGAEGEEVYLVLFGTGLRSRVALSTVRATIGNEELELLYAGAQGAYVGLDQLNLRLPRTLAGRGEVDLQLWVEGKLANTVRISLR